MIQATAAAIAGGLLQKQNDRKKELTE